MERPDPNITYWRSVLEAAERELGAATGNITLKSRGEAVHARQGRGEAAGAGGGFRLGSVRGTTAGMIHALIFLALVLLAHPVLAQQCPRGTLTGNVTHVRDGDTIEVGGMAIRLNGIAAPEWDEPGGAEASAAMRAMVHGRELRCQLNGRRTYDRCVGVCYLDGEDIEAAMVRRGFARDCRGTAVASMPRRSAKRRPRARRSGRSTRCRGIAGRGDRALLPFLRGNRPLPLLGVAALV